MAENKVPHHAFFHRALVALILAGSLSLAAYRAGFAWYFLLPAVFGWGVGIWYLKRGSDRCNETPH